MHEKTLSFLNILLNQHLCLTLFSTQFREWMRKRILFLNSYGRCRPTDDLPVWTPKLVVFQMILSWRFNFVMT